MIIGTVRPEAPGGGKNVRSYKLEGMLAILSKDQENFNVIVYH